MRQFRLVHVGVAAAIAAATVTAVGLAQSAGATGGTASVFVPIVPCRLVDTRPAPNNVGTLSTPLQAAQVVTFAVWGSNGNCTIPTSATGIATNATAVHPTADSYVTIYPADASPRPTASNLNVVAGQAPTPNQVTVGLSAAGAISAYNNGGTLDLVIDIVGYYQPAPTGGIVNNDARYYTKDQIDAKTMFASVNKDGSLRRGSAGVTSAPFPAGMGGDYLVTFPRDITTCVFVESTASTTEGNNPVPGYVGATLQSTTTTKLYVQVYTITGGTTTQQPFNVIVTCP